MRRLPASALVLLVLVACGSPDPNEARLGFSFDALAVSEVGMFQIAVVEEPSFNCAAAKADCLADQVAGLELLQIRASGGSEQKVVQIDAALTTSADGGLGTQTVEIEVPVGENYAVIIEALSADHRFIGSSCTFLEDVFRTGASMSAERLILDKDPAVCSQTDARVSP